MSDSDYEDYEVEEQEEDNQEQEDSSEQIEDDDQPAQMDSAYSENDSDPPGMYDDDSDDIQQRIQQEKEHLIANEDWGTKRQNFYGRNKEADDISSEDDVDELGEAVRLQAIRAKKLNAIKQKQQEVEESDDSQDKQELDESAQSASESEGEGLGDKLFGSKIDKNVKDKDQIQKLKQDKLLEIKELIQDMKEVIASLDYEIEYPEDEELNEADVYSFIKQLTIFIKKYACNKNKVSIKRNKRVFDFLKVKEQLVLNYCLYMNFYLLGQAKILQDSTKFINLQENEVLKKLAYYRTLIKQIEPIDSQLKEQLSHIDIDKIIPEAENNEGEKDEDFEGDYEIEGPDEDIEDFEGDIEDEQDQEIPIQKKSKKKEKSSKKTEIEPQKKSKKKKEGDEYASIENMLNFGNFQQEESHHSDENQDGEVKEVNKIIEKVFKKKKKENKKKVLQGNVDDLVSEDEAPKPKNRLKKKPKYEAEQTQEMQDKKQFEGADGVDGEGVYDKGELSKQKKRELKEKKKQEKLMKIDEEIKRKNDSIQKNMYRNIMKGTGIYRKRPKVNRNPRVKHRKKYEKALVERKRKVQEYKEGPQSKYAGELTGIRSNLIKSTKL